MEKQPTILILEDEQNLSQALGEYLSDQFVVLVANNGEDGLKQALTSHPDLILLDLLMPKMGGQEVLDALRKDAWGKGVPVIVLTNLSSPDEAARALQKDVTDFLVKSDMALEDIAARIQEKIGS